MCSSSIMIPVKLWNNNRMINFLKIVCMLIHMNYKKCYFYYERGKQVSSHIFNTCLSTTTPTPPPPQTEKQMEMVKEFV